MEKINTSMRFNEEFRSQFPAKGKKASTLMRKYGLKLPGFAIYFAMCLNAPCNQKLLG